MENLIELHFVPLVCSSNRTQIWDTVWAHVSDADSSQLRGSKVKGTALNGGNPHVHSHPTEKENEMDLL